MGDKEHYMPFIASKKFQLESLILDLKQLRGTVMPEQPEHLCKTQSPERQPRKGLLRGHSSEALV